MQKISVSEMMKAVTKLESDGIRVTQMGIGPMSEPVIKAALQLAKEKDFPVMFIASRNQIDAQEFGRGYVHNWDQYDFVNAVRKMVTDTGFDGLYYICRDHGGPWQRDEERADKLPPEQAMEIAKKSYLHDLKAGFDLLHIDPTKDPHADGVVPIDTVLSRTVELIEYVETERVKLNLPPVSYEVGTEETNGGLTSQNAFSDFLHELTSRLSAKNLPLPLFIVGQTGTLVRMLNNVGQFDSEAAQKLSAEAKKYGTGLKEHNADYLYNECLIVHPVLGVTAANIAPEFGVAETSAYFILARIEKKFNELGLIDKTSNFANHFCMATVRGERWRKWLIGEDSKKTVDEVLSDQQLTSYITSIGGHYSFGNPDVLRETGIMFENLKACGVNPEKAVLDAIKYSMQRYVNCFNLAGLTGRIKTLLNY